MSQFCQDFTKRNISSVFKNFHNSSAADSKINYNSRYIINCNLKLKT